jgi:adenine-specific DNA-methyltransferase
MAFCTDAIALLGIALGTHTLDNQSIQRAVADWMSRFLWKSYQMLRVQDWQRCFLAIAQQLIHVNPELVIPATSTVADIRVALHSKGLLLRDPSMTEQDEQHALSLLKTGNQVTRVTGPCTVEATIPTPVDWEGDGIEDSGAVKLEEHGSFVDRMLEVLRKSPVLHLSDGKTVTLKNVRPPAKTLSLSAEAVVTNPHPSPLPEGEEGQAVALVFGPENGAISEKLVYEAAREAHAKSYAHLYIIGFAIQPNARRLVEDSDAAVGIPSTYVQATPDLVMGDLLKNMRSSQIFSVCGLPEVKLHRLKPRSPDHPVMYQAELLGLDVFDPTTMETDHRAGDDVPAWLLDTDYNGLCFHVTQAFFPRTSAWDNLKRALKGLYEDSLWDHLAGTKSAPFEAGEHGQVAV